VACQLEPPKRSPVLLAARREPARCRACQPSAAAPRPRPLRCGLPFHRARRVKAAQEDGLPGGGALVLALTRCATLGQPHGGSVVKGSKGVDF